MNIHSPAVLFISIRDVPRVPKTGVTLPLPETLARERATRAQGREQGRISMIIRNHPPLFAFDVAADFTSPATCCAQLPPPWRRACACCADDVIVDENSWHSGFGFSGCDRAGPKDELSSVSPLSPLSPAPSPSQCQSPRPSSLCAAVSA